MHVSKASVLGNPNIGLYGYATDSYCILGPEAKTLVPLLEEVLDVPIIITTIAGTSMAGAFCTGTNDVLLVPNIVFEAELHALEKAGITVKIFETNHTALGNNIITNEHGALIGPMFSDEERGRLSELLGIPVHQFGVAAIEVVGSSIVATTKGGIIHRDASQFELDMAQDTLRLPKLMQGTVNFGVPFVRTGIIANSNGFLIGSSSGGPEIAHADEALGFIEG